MNNYERVQVTSREGWRDWLVEHHEQKESIWLVIYKKHTGSKYLPYCDIVEQALCFGWIDSVQRRMDADRSMILLSPRRPKSAWSKSNKDRMARLIKGRSMTPAGLAKIDQAKKDGSWAFLDDVEAMIIPLDLAKALNGNKKAKTNFDAFSDSVKKQTLQFVKTAKQVSTRVKRIQKVVDMAKENKRFTG